MKRYQMMGKAPSAISPAWEEFLGGPSSDTEAIGKSLAIRMIQCDSTRK